MQHKSGDFLFVVPELQDYVEDIPREPRQEERDADQQDHHVRPMPPAFRLRMPALKRSGSCPVKVPQEKKF